MGQGSAPALALRVSYVGELGWELHIPTEYALHAYETLWEAGEALGVVNAGYRAIESLRLEKGYRYWSADISGDYNPYEAGLGFAVKLDKGDFVGRSALLKIKAEGPKRRLCCLSLGQAQVQLYGGETLLSGNKSVGRVSSGGYGYTLGQTIAYGYLPADLAKPGTKIEVSVLGERHLAVVEKEPLYDPMGARIKA